jgi:hypothetical protein
MKQFEERESGMHFSRISDFLDFFASVYMSAVCLAPFSEIKYI